MIKQVLGGLCVADHEAAVTWYERLLGRPADAVPMAGLAEWHFEGTGSVQVIGDGDRAGGSRLTLKVDDLDRYVADLAERGLAAGEVTPGDTVMFALVTDPDGNEITIVADRSPSTS
jgi:catechol 2,3-dioxygenase-like lactoylglutathione lyase family enzyme